MKPPVTFGISNQMITIIIFLATRLNIICYWPYEVIWIDKVFSCIVRWIYIHHFHLTKIIFA